MSETYIQRLTKSERRNAKIRLARATGKTYQQLATQFDISRARAHVICSTKRKRNGR